MEFAFLGLIAMAVVGKVFRRKKKKVLGEGISIIIPFRESNMAPERLRNVTWLKQYWAANMPGAEVIIGEDPDTSRPFSKAKAINNGVAKSTGDILVLMDADGYMPVESVQYCADEIRHAIKRGLKLWFVPYRQFYRLSEEASKKILDSDPKAPFTYPEFPGAENIINDTNPRAGHWYGAMVQLCPREAFETLGGWDERFCGWGGEDHAMMRAMDTVYWPHKTLPGSVLHIWHPMLGNDGLKTLVSWRERRWEGQVDPTTNNKLSWRYYHAFNKPAVMRKLVDEWKQGKPADPGAPEHKRTSM